MHIDLPDPQPLRCPSTRTSRRADGHVVVTRCSGLGGHLGPCRFPGLDKPAPTSPPNYSWSRPQQ